METNKAAKQPYKTVGPVIDNRPYIMAIIAMAFLAIAGTVTIQALKPEIDNTSIIIEIFGFSAAIITGIFAAMKSQEAAMRSQETHLAVNSRLDQWMEKAEQLALAQGIAEGAARADARTDMLAHQQTSDTVSEIKIDTGALRRQAEEDAKKKSGEGGAG